MSEPDYWWLAAEVARITRLNIVAIKRMIEQEHEEQRKAESEKCLRVVALHPDQIYQQRRQQTAQRTAR